MMDTNLRTSETRVNDITSTPPELPGDLMHDLSGHVRRTRAETIHLLTEETRRRTHNPRGGLR